jgi:parallel beta-helix repeat protein
MPIDINSTYDFVLTTLNNMIYVGGNGPNNYSRIQDAIDNASNGDTIFVYNGFYQENIHINKAVILNGEDRNNTIIDGGKSGAISRAVISISKSFAGISNFTIQNSTIYDIHDGIILRNIYDISINDNNFIGCGISYDYITPNTISFRNTIKNNTANGKPLIYLEGLKNKIIDYPTGQIILAGCENITISHQNISNLHNGIVLYQSNNCTLYKNRITDTGYGIVVYHSNYNNLSENTLYNNGVGIISGASCQNVFFKNIIEFNENGIYDNISPYVYGSDNNIIIKNILKNNSEGISLLWSKPAVIKYNYIENNKLGIGIGHSSYSFIENNNFYDNKKGVYLIEIKDNLTTIIDGNYWDRTRILPKPIFGLKKYGDGLFSVIPWIFFDWNPATEPFDIMEGYH